MKLNRYRLALKRIIRDWRDRETEKPRNVMPTGMTTATLRFYRQIACKRAGVSDCECWTCGTLETPPGENPCAECSVPGISMRDYSIAAFGKRPDGEPVKDERILRKWMNAGAPMQPDDFRTFLANAFAQGWMPANHVLTRWEQLSEFEATSSVLRRFVKRLRERAVREEPFNLSSLAGDGSLERDFESEVDVEEINAEKVRQDDEVYARACQRIELSRGIDADNKKWLLATNLPQ